LYDLKTQKIFVSRDVVFSKHEFPYDPNQLGTANLDEINTSECMEGLDHLEEREGAGVPFDKDKGDES